MTEYLYNIHDETAEITETKTGAIIKMPSGNIKTFNNYDAAVNYLYKRGFIF